MQTLGAPEDDPHGVQVVGLPHHFPLGPTRPPTQGGALPYEEAGLPVEIAGHLRVCVRVGDAVAHEEGYVGKVVVVRDHAAVQPQVRAGLLSEGGHGMTLLCNTGATEMGKSVSCCVAFGKAIENLGGR